MHETEEVAELSGLKVLSIINEPKAAAIYERADSQGENLSFIVGSWFSKRYKCAILIWGTYAPSLSRVGQTM